MEIAPNEKSPPNDQTSKEHAHGRCNLVSETPSSVPPAGSIDRGSTLRLCTQEQVMCHHIGRTMGCTYVPPGGTPARLTAALNVF